MTIKTNMSFDTLSRYAKMMEANEEHDYTPTGDNLVEIIENEDSYAAGSFVLTSDYLVGDCEWQIEKQESMLEESDYGACHEWYLEGDRSDSTIDGVEFWRKERKRLRSWAKNLSKWEKSVEEVEVWEYDPTKVDFAAEKKVEA